MGDNETKICLICSAVFLFLVLILNCFGGIPPNYYGLLCNKITK